MSVSITLDGETIQRINTLKSIAKNINSARRSTLFKLISPINELVTYLVWKYAIMKIPELAC